MVYLVLTLAGATFFDGDLCWNISKPERIFSPKLGEMSEVTECPAGQTGYSIQEQLLQLTIIKAKGKIINLCLMSLQYEIAICR